MDQCGFDTCTARNSLIDGYCRTHRKRGTAITAATSGERTSSSSNAASNDADMKAWMLRMESKIDNMLSTLQFEVTQLNNQVDELKTENAELKTEINMIKARQNTQFFAYKVFLI